MKRLEQLKKEIKNIEITYDYESVYCDLINATIDYQNDTQTWDFEYIFNDYIDYETAEDMARNELENGGLIRLYYFLGDANLNNEIFRVDGYGNLTNFEKSDLEYIKDEILTVIEQLEESEAN